MSDWKKLTDTIEYQQGWSPRDTMEDKTLRKFSESCEYFDISDKIDAAIAIIDGYLYHNHLQGLVPLLIYLM